MERCIPAVIATAAAPAAAENAALLRGSKIPADALRRLSARNRNFSGLSAGRCCSILTLLANWLKLVCYNFPFAFFTQLFFIQPLVRTLFKAIFRRKNEK